MFQIFYFIINFGSFFSTILTPLLYAWWGPEVAFGVPGIMMGLATFLFWLGRNKFVPVPPKPGGKLGFLDFAASVLLFMPVLAIIVAVFVEGGHYEAEKQGARSAVEFYADYVTSYIGYLAVASWPYFVGAAVLVVVGLVLFNIRQNKKPDTGFLAVLLYAYKHRGERKEGQKFFDVAREKYGDEAAEGPAAVLKIMLVFSMVSVFWALFDQHASTWVAQAKQMNRSITVPYYLGRYAVGATVALALYGGTWLVLWVSNVKIQRSITVGVAAIVGAAGVGALILDLMGGQWVTIELKAAQIAALNPLMVMMIIPLLNVAVYRPLEKRGVEVRPLRKMTIGMFMAAFAFRVGRGDPGAYRVLRRRPRARALAGRPVPHHDHRRGAGLRHGARVRLHPGAPRHEVDHHGVLAPVRDVRQRARRVSGTDADDPVAVAVLLGVHRAHDGGVGRVRDPRLLLQGQDLPSDLKLCSSGV